MAYTTIDDPSAYFKVQLYTGTGSSLAVTFNDTDTDMQPDLVWLKVRNTTGHSQAFDASRGVTKVIYPSQTDPEGTVAESLKTFDSDGFTLGTSSYTNTSSNTYVAWCWKESATSGFDIVTYTGNGSARTISHSLSAVPHLMMIKHLESGDYDWRVYHHKNTSAPETDYLRINTTDQTTDSPEFNDTAPTSSVFSVGTTDGVNEDGQDFIAWLFTNIQGYSKFGSYTGNGNADGPFVYTGFRPAWIILKNSSTTNGWNIWDTKRSTFNPADDLLPPHTTGAESTSANWTIDILSNGFKARDSNNEANGSGNTLVYAAFAEAPFVNSNGVPCNAR